MKISIEQLLRGCNPLGRRGLRCAVLAAITATAFGALAETISDRALQQISALRAEKDSRTPAQQKMDSQLVYALKESLNQVIAPGVTNLRVLVQREADGRVRVDLKATVTPELLDFIKTFGGTVVSSVPQFQAVRAVVPLPLTETLAGRADVQFVRSAVPGMARTGSVDSEGDTTHRAIDARPAFNVNGYGVKVGVLSDSVDYMSQAISTGDLPPNVTVLPGQGGSGAGEGTAMLEIIYDLAPGAQLFFATGFNGEAQFAQNILDLRAAGCDIIVDDIFYFDESPFQDAIVARAVNAVTASGALYFSAAGNEGNLTHGTSGTWEGDFADGGPAGPPVNGKGGTLHSFGANPYDTVTGIGFATVLLWSDALGASANDYDLYVLDSSGSTVVSSSTTVQNGSQDPFEIVPSPNVGERVVVVRATGAARFLHIDTIRGQLAINTAGNITGHPTATNAFACSAVDVHTAYPNPFSGGPANPVESFSSDGPRRVFYNADGTPITPGNFLSTGGYVRPKPDITAADGVVTTLPPFSGLNPFFGTSAAAPHAAAIATLLKSYNPTLTPSQVRTILTSTALDNEAVGYDFNSGYGIVMAFQALQAAPPLLTPVLVMVTNVISGGNGNGIIDFNECNNLSLLLTNIGRADATGVRGTLSTITPGVVVAQPISTYPNIPVGGGVAVNQTPFRVSTSPSFVCGTPIDFALVVKCDQATFTNLFRLPTGVPGTPLRFDNSTPVLIPDAGETNSVIVVSNVTAALSKVTASLYLTHTYDLDLVIQLISPDGTTNTLTASNGGSGQNYGAACSPDSQRTTFDDDATQPISAGFAPFIGSFQPQTPLSVFIGKAGTNVNGDWRLRLVDQYAQDVGTLQCWSLFLTPADCKDGGGECPGADLALGMVAQPEPAMVGGTLTYTISVTNNGPSSARNVMVTQLLPNGVIFISATSSQGSCSQSGGLVTGNLGTLAYGGRATVTVVVIPATTGTISSTASVTSDQSDPIPSNNSAVVISHVIPLSVDLAVGLAAAPSPVVLGNPLTYTISVTNNGPSTGSGISVTSVLPAGAGVLSATVSQGSITTGGGLWTLGTLAIGARATATITVFPATVGTITATASVAGNQFDPVAANNVAAVSTVVGPAADLAISIADSPDPAVVLGNVKYVVSVTNSGPSAATSVNVSVLLPTSVNVISNSAAQATNGSALTWSLGTVNSGAKATLTIVVQTTTNGTLSTSATIAGSEPDPNPANNSATATTTVAAPFVNIVAAGASLTYAWESGPTNDAVDVGETVTNVILNLRNVGNISVQNVVATLLATNGVVPVPPNTPQTYQILFPSSDPNSKPVGHGFSFTANGTNGGTISPTLQLQAGTNTYPPVSFTFTLPSLQTFANTNGITIPDPAAPHPYYPLQSGPAKPYPSIITVSNFNGVLGKVTVTLSNLNHTYVGDVNALLVGPNGAKTVLMSHAGTPLGVAGVNLAFDDSAPSPLPVSDQLVSGVWQPAAYGPAPSFPTNAPVGPYSAALSAFNASNPNGTWSLYIFDDSGGDAGVLLGGWSLSLNTITPVDQLADLSVTVTDTPDPVPPGGTLTYTFTVANNGPNAATFVGFTNALPAGVTIVSPPVASQGSVTNDSNTVIANLGTVSTGAVATVTVVVSPLLSLIPPGANTATLTSTATVGGSEADSNPGNNTASAVTTIRLPVADVGVSLTAAPDSVVAGYNLTNTVVVTNLGPGTALAVVLTNPLPTNVTLVSVSSTVDFSTNIVGTNVICSLPDLAANAGATVTLVVVPMSSVIPQGSSTAKLTNIVYVATASQDTNSANNSASYTNTVTIPTAVIIAAGAAMTYESGPFNGLIDSGEKVTLALSLANVGSLDTSNLVATLLTNGISNPSGPQNYGAVIHGGLPVARSFTFTNDAASGSPVILTLQLQDQRPTATNNLGTVAFTFNPPATSAWSDTAAIIIPEQGSAAPYPSTITVTGLVGVVTKATVTLNGFVHSFPHDVSALLVGPSGANVLFMSHVGGGYSLTNPITLTFDDTGTNAALPNYDPLTGGTTNKSSTYPGAVTFPAPAPSGPYGSTLVAVNGQTNGTWSLFVFDDTTGDRGYIENGWSLGLTTAETLRSFADLAIALSTTPGSLFVGGALTNTIWVTNLGPAAATGVVVTNTLSTGQQVITSLGGLAAGATAKATVILTPSAAGMIVCTASVGGNEADLNPANNSAQTTTALIVPAPAVLDASIVKGQFQLIVTAQPGLVYAIQSSTNLTSWTSLTTTTAPPDGTFTFIDPIPPGSMQRYYRTLRLTP